MTGTKTRMNTAMMLFNNGYAVTVMDTSSNMMVQVTTQQPAVSNHDDPLEHYVTDTTNDCQDDMLVLTSTHIHSVVLPSVNHSIYCYFSYAFEVSSYACACPLVVASYCVLWPGGVCAAN